jgi:hexokinase
MMTPMAAPDEIPDEAVVARTAALFAAPAAALDAVAREHTRQMARGLVGEPSSLKMLRTFTRPPSGHERGRVVVGDWGGSKARAGLAWASGPGTGRSRASPRRRIPSRRRRRGARPSRSST